MSTEELVRVTVLANRNPKLSETEFNDHWANKHGPLITSWLQRHGIVKYVQVSFPLPIQNLACVKRILFLWMLTLRSIILHQNIERF
jgi:hypothetical protein